MRRFHAKAEHVPGQPGRMGTSIISVLDNDRVVGRYERNYPSFGETTFYAFEQNGQWYALYSKDYTATRVMSLPDCRDLGGEQPSSGGFCPVEFYVPSFRKRTVTNAWGQTDDWFTFDNSPFASSPDGPELGPQQFLKTGFVAGCLWGDDSSWKLQVIDVGQAAAGIIKREERFGYLELPFKTALKEALYFGLWRPDRPVIKVSRLDTRNLATGEVLDPLDF